MAKWWQCQPAATDTSPGQIKEPSSAGWSLSMDRWPGKVGMPLPHSKFRLMRSACSKGTSETFRILAQALPGTKAQSCVPRVCSKMKMSFSIWNHPKLSPLQPDGSQREGLQEPRVSLGRSKQAAQVPSGKQEPAEHKAKDL